MQINFDTVQQQQVERAANTLKIHVILILWLTISNGKHEKKKNQKLFTLMTHKMICKNNWS